MRRAVPVPASDCRQLACRGQSWRDQCRSVARSSRALSRLRRVAGSLFFNDPFEQAHGKGHAACLDGLKIAWREQCLADVLDGTERLALDERKLYQVHALEQIGGRRRRRRDVKTWPARTTTNRRPVLSARFARCVRPAGHRVGQQVRNAEDHSNIMDGLASESWEPRGRCASSERYALRVGPKPSWQHNATQRFAKKKSPNIVAPSTPSLWGFESGNSFKSPRCAGS